MEGEGHPLRNGDYVGNIADQSVGLCATRPESESMRLRVPPSFANPITLVGVTITTVCFIVIGFLVVVEALATEPNPYIGILAFIIVPTILLGGVAVAILGIWRENRRRRAGLPEGKLPVINFNNPAHRVGLMVVIVLGVPLALASALGSVQAYHAMETDAFCGTSCHVPMEPEYTAYQVGPHARVGCVKCHIGSGADWFNKFPRPIRTPIVSLRPAQETCEQCHWPQQFFSQKLMRQTYYQSVGSGHEQSSIDLLIKVGGGNKEAGPTSGIHWHMNIRNKITYVATDDRRQAIPWVKMEGPDGEVRVFRDTSLSFTPEDSANGEQRRMDCVDCHNRPAHQYRNPQRMINHLMSLGWIDPALPQAKTLAVHVLEDSYSTAQIAQDSIRASIEAFYAQNFPAVARAKRDQIERMIHEVQGLFAKNYFPAMRTDWKRHPDNIGHMYFLGCFRCHDGKHLDEKGKPITNDCNACHTIIGQQVGNRPKQVSDAGLKYIHPVDVGSDWTVGPCSECHSTKPDESGDKKTKHTVASARR